MDHNSKFVIVIVDTETQSNFYNIPYLLKNPPQIPLRLSTLEHAIGFTVPSTIPNIVIDTSKIFMINAAELANLDIEEDLLGTIFPLTQSSFIEDFKLIYEASSNWHENIIA